MYQRILFTHDDMDGGGCRVVFTLCNQDLTYGRDYTIIECSNNGVDDQVMEVVNSGKIDQNTTVFFGDICCCRDTLRTLLDQVKCRVIILDHHRTNFWAEADVKYPSECHIIPINELNKMECGTAIMYQWFSKNLPEKHPLNTCKPLIRDVELFVDTIRSYDTYEWKETGNILAKQLNILFFMLGSDRFCDLYLKRFLRGFDNGGSYPAEPLIPETAMMFVEAKMANEQKTIDEVTLDNFVITDVRGHLCALMVKSAAANFSELANQFLIKHPEIELCINPSFYDGGKYEIRTAKDDLDTGADIAKPIGGGGHPKASGAPFSEKLKAVLTSAFIAHLNGYEPEYPTFEGDNKV